MRNLVFLILLAACGSPESLSSPDLSLPACPGGVDSNTGYVGCDPAKDTSCHAYDVVVCQCVCACDCSPGKYFWQCDAIAAICDGGARD
jgi:hypothetical protein